MISSLFNIGVSGLRTQQQIMKMHGENVSNVGTPGYKRQENYNYTLDFSGPNNQPYNPGGVGTTINIKNNPLADRMYQLALRDNSEQTALRDGVNSIQNVLKGDKAAEAFTGLKIASQALMQDPNNSVLKADFNAKVEDFAKSINTTENGMKEVANTITKKIDFQQKELESLQSQLSNLTTRSNTPDVVQQINAIKQQISRLTGSISGYNKVLRSVIPPVTGLYNSAKEEAVNNINSNYGSELISTVNSKLTANKVVGDIEKLATSNGTKFIDDMGVVKTTIGNLQQSSDIEFDASNLMLDDAQKQYDTEFGVDLVQETVKMKEAQRLYEANAQLIKTADEMLGTILSIKA